MLLTDEGDADLYASTVTKQHDHSDNQYSSYSCGLDLIVMPTSTPAQSQQVHVTVVGHGRHEVSRYKLVIISPSYDDINKYQVRVTQRHMIAVCHYNVYIHIYR